jgi:hypothetical protein
MAEFLKRWWPNTLVGGIIGYLTTKVLLFRSHLLLAMLAAVGVGLVTGLAEAGWRRLVRPT